MRIKDVTSDFILFDNKTYITSEHYRDCCEINYADFEQIEQSAFDVEFDENLVFEEVETQGFRFGSINTPMFFVPCYADQNGYYSSDVEIYYDSKQVLNVNCEMRD